MNTDKIWAEAIAKEYAPKDDSKVIALKKLDQKAKLPATVFAYSFGIVSSLVAGLGMCLAMQVIGEWTVMFVLGIIIGIIGFSACGIKSSSLLFRLGVNSYSLYFSPQCETIPSLTSKVRFRPF